MYRIDIGCIDCGRRFWKKVMMLKDVWTTWSNNSFCELCSKKKGLKND